MATLPPGSSLAFAEIDRPGKFAGPLADPKIAMRLGFADASLVSQFLHPPDDEADGADDTIPHRALAAWQDGLRQAGLASLPQHSLGGQIPADLQYLAVWIVRKNKSGPTGHAHFLPVAVLMRPETPGALGITPRLSQWLPYGELLQAIGQHGTIEESWAREAAQAAAERFIRQVLYMVRNRPTLLLTNAQNIRSWWPSLTNSAVIRDQVGFADSMSPAALYGPGLRHVRVRHAESFETPQWFAPNETTGRPGLAEGLWLPGGAGPGNRVFGSTTAKPATAMHAAVSASKLVPRSGERPRVDTGQQAWNPSLLEITVLACAKDDNPEAFAALTHQLRISPDHSDALKLPGRCTWHPSPPSTCSMPRSVRHRTRQPGTAGQRQTTLRACGRSTGAAEMYRGGPMRGIQDEGWSSRVHRPAPGAWPARQRRPGDRHVAARPLRRAGRRELGGQDDSRGRRLPGAQQDIPPLASYPGGCARRR